MKKIILIPNCARDHRLKETQRAEAILREHGIQTTICLLAGDGEIPDIPDTIKTSDLEEELPCAEMVITFGGDGTILRAVRAVPDVPVLGVNMGGKGFMAELERGDIEGIISAVRGEYVIDSRMMLDAQLIREGEVICEDFALNDVVISGINKVIDLTVYGDGQRISHFSGDGVIIATPTGSTAYSMAAGGPIVEPTASNILITPICAHVLESKPYVLVSDRTVTVEIGLTKANPALLAIDGCDNIPIYSGDMVTVKKSMRTARLVQLAKRSFYRKVSEKLGERL